MKERLSYEKAGVSIDAADAAKKQMAQSLSTSDPRVLNRLGAFASLLDGVFPEHRRPVLVLKMEEPGSKQALCIRHGSLGSLASDLVNHLVNDIAVMGARPLAVLDTIVCGKLEKQVVVELVDQLARACREQGCTLVGGETSEQPGVVPAGSYVLSAAVLGVVERDRIIDGSRIAVGDAVVSIASNGPHTNGYTLIRKLLEADPALARKEVGGESFLSAILRPHTSYLNGLERLFPLPALHGLGHITGGGLEGNLNRILPPGTAASIDLGMLRPPPIFEAIRAAGNIADPEMMRTFNMGVGIAAVAAEDSIKAMVSLLADAGHRAYPIGRIVQGNQTVELRGRIPWKS